MLEKLCEHLKSEEGWRPHVYQDHLEYDTIGYGFLVHEGMGEGLPKEIGEQWLRLIASRYWWQLTAKHPWLLDQPEEVQIALGSMAYQLGVAGVCTFRDMLGALKEGNRSLAADYALDSLWARQTPARANRVAAMIRG